MNRCQHCKTITDLHLISHRTLKSGKIVSAYMCCKCSAERAREYRKTKRGKEVTYRVVQRSTKKYWNKTLARQAVSDALKRGLIVKPKHCELCGKIGKLDGHHKDYSKRLEVNWYCRRCHSKVHKSIITK